MSWQRFLAMCVEQNDGQAISDVGKRCLSKFWKKNHDNIAMLTINGAILFATLKSCGVL